MIFSRKNILKLLVICAFCFSFYFSLNAFASSSVLSPALKEFEKQISLQKCGVIGKSVTFSAKDFDDTFLTKTEFIKIESLPDANDGVLKLASFPVGKNQIIERKDFDKINFTPAANELTFAAFTVSNATVSEKNVCANCYVSVLPEKNFAPETSAFNIETFKNVSVFNTLKVTDPDDDDIFFEVVSYPKNGTIDISKNDDGYFCYSPRKGFVGKDSFEYVAKDTYGNKSDPCKVSISVSKPDKDIYFDDLKNHPCHVSAIKTASLGLISGSYDDASGEYLFNPDGTVSRGDFLAMALISAGKEDEINFVSKTDFSDDESIPLNIKSYVNYAYTNGIISGYPADNGKIFASKNPITLSEAAVIINNILSLDEKISPASASFDNQNIPAWASNAISVLSSYGVFDGTEFGNIIASTPLTRAQTVMSLQVFFPN